MYFILVSFPDPKRAPVKKGRDHDDIISRFQAKMANSMIPSKAVRNEVGILCTNEGSTPLCVVSGLCLPDVLSRHGNCKAIYCSS